MPRLLIVSNRLPVSTRLDGTELTVEPSPGGLASGLKGPHESSGGLWIGWPGDTSRLDAQQIAKLEQSLSDLRTVPIYLTNDEVQAYYAGMANGVLWPLFHYLIDRVPYHVGDWEAFRRVNERFASVVAERYQAGDVIWVHDYQLALVPALVREQIPDARIGFFLHIPFPATEVLRTFPWREELLQGLLGADLVGFHTLSYARHFGNSLIHVLGLTPDLDRVRFGGRTVRFGAFPMGIDYPSFNQDALSEEVAVECERLRHENGPMRLLLGVDRLDYTKGVPRRLLAIERLLQKNPELRGGVRLVQVAVPSRTDVEEYGAFASEVNELVGRINGAFGTPSWTPVHYLHRSFSRSDLVAMYRAADVMLVTPLRDGMNLVAKEFVASRTDERGVLVLSELAGAAAEMGEALLVNPYHVDAVADALAAALKMSEPEQRTRMRMLRQRVARFDVHHWASSFLGALDEAGEQACSDAPAVLNRKLQAELVERARDAKLVLLLLDYDGTLVPFARQPELAFPDEALLGLLEALARNPRYRVHVISGRPREVLEGWLGPLDIGLHGEHGLWSRMPGQQWRLNREVDPSWKPRVRPVLEQYVASTPGSLIEEKSHSMAWHYRVCDPEFAEWQARELKLHLTHALSNVPVTVLSGDRVVELQPHNVNKGLVAAEICHNNPGALTVAAGDDETDENLFAALPTDAISLHVGSRPSRARYNLRDAAALRKLLGELL